MEIFQTIWNALISENAMLTKIICGPLMFLETYLSMLLFITILKINCENKQKIIYTVIVSVIGLFTIFFVPTPYNTFINVIICPILIMLIFNVSIFKAIFAEIIPYILFITIGSLLINIYLELCNISAASSLTIPIYKFCYSLILYLFVYIIYLLLHHFHINITLLTNIKRENHKIFLINFSLGIIAITIQSYLATILADSLTLKNSILSVLVLLIYFIFSLYSLARTAKLDKTTQDLEQEKSYNRALNILYDDIRGFKHDFNNTVQSIGGYISSDNIEGLKTYYQDLLIDCQKANNLSVLNPEIINNPAIYCLLTSKYNKADELGIKSDLEVLLDLSTINMRPYELSKVLGILLDNAIEASKQTKEKQINVTFKKDIKANRQLIIIENSYSNKDVNTEKIFEKGYTSKLEDDKNHGLGLWEVRQILKKNINLNLYTSKNDTYFSQQLEIY